MEKHHRLRRDPSWSPHGCNICGQEGHQAANCSNGTVNWVGKYGSECFVLKPSKPLYAPVPVEPDYNELTARAKAYAEAKNTCDVTVTLATLTGIAQQEFAGLQQVAPTPVPVAAAAPAPAPVVTPPPAGTVVAGWTTYYDAMRRPYYHNAVTAQTVWEMPAEMKAAQAAGPPPAAGAAPAPMMMGQ